MMAIHFVQITILGCQSSISKHVTKIIFLGRGCSDVAEIGLHRTDFPHKANFHFLIKLNHLKIQVKIKQNY